MAENNKKVAAAAAAAAPAAAAAENNGVESERGETAANEKNIKINHRNRDIVDFFVLSCFLFWPHISFGRSDDGGGRGTK